MKTNSLKIILATGILTLAILACSSFATSTPVPTLIPTIPPTAVPLYQQVTLTSVEFKETGEAPNYTITAQTPTLQGVDDPRATAFNTKMQTLVNGLVNEFKTGMKDMPAVPITGGSSIDVKYALLSPLGDIFSLKFEISGYADGAAHPYHYSRAVNFNIETGQDVTLDQLFTPGSNYLEVIAQTCKAELSARMNYTPGDPFEQGSDPLPENYQNWNITADGLLITFDEYQVAPYAAGPQTVVIPYSALKSVINLQGPLGKFIQ